jgi:hypothetical protein
VTWEGMAAPVGGGGDVARIMLITLTAYGWCASFSPCVTGNHLLHIVSCLLDHHTCLLAGHAVWW